MAHVRTEPAHIRIYCRIKTIKTIEIQIETIHIFRVWKSCDISIYDTHASNFGLLQQRKIH